MKIESFSKFVEDSELQPMVLRDATVVADGTNFFYRSYHASNLSYEFGCESHLYAKYLRNYLSIFKKANVKCFFLFKGGHENVEKRLRDNYTKTHVCPIFMRNIYKEVLDEMGFDYVICEYESKRDVIALSQKLDCPIVSNDIEFCFSGCQYIPSPELKFNAHENTIECRYFLLENFLKKYNLTEDKIAIFIVLTDIQHFHGRHFAKLFQHIKSPLNCYKRNCHLLRWLSKHSSQQSMKTISMFISPDSYNNFSAILSKVRLMIARREAGGVGAAWLSLRGAPSAAGTGNWFPAGVAARHVAIDYVNLYRSKHCFGSEAIKSRSCEDDAMFLSLPIVKYALDLLTDFQNDGFVFVCDTESGRDTMTFAETHVRRPDYEAKVCVFENGWSEVRHLGLFEHFLKESLQRQELTALGWVPRGARLLVAALLYCARRKPAGAGAGAAAVLLSYVMLSVVFEKMDKDDLPQSPFYRKRILSPTTDKDDVTEVDCNTAAAIMQDYVSTSLEEISDIYDRELVYPLIEFQHCLSQLSDLNALCGAPLPPVPLRRAYAGPLVYKLRRAARGRDPRRFLNELLNPAPTVLAYLNGLLDVYESML